MTRLEQLEKEISAHNVDYWVLDDPSISDTEYDKLMLELRDLDPDHNLLVYVGGEKGKVKHEVPMLSLDKVYTEEEFSIWALKVARGLDEVFCINPKYDGLAADKTGGVLASRGDGEYGEDISDKLEYIQNPPVDGQRGEIGILKSQLPDKYKTPRAAASGLVNTSKIDENTKLLTFFSYDSNTEECTLGDLPLIDWPATMLDMMNEDYPTDGIVISLKDREYGETLGGTSHHPNHSIAFKYGNPTGETKLVDVIWQVGKHKITPVGIVEPVEIDGYTNTRMSLHNFDETAKVKIGDTIIIERCGSVIPQLKSVKRTSKKSEFINCPVCPACGTKTEYKSPNIICPNDNCGGMISKVLHDSLVRLGVENIGPSTVSLLVAEGLTSLSEVFDSQPVMWESLEGFGEKKVQQKLDSLQAVLGSPIEDFKVLAALNVEGVGVSLSKKICAEMNLAEIEVCKDFTHLDGVGSITSDKLNSDLTSKFGLLRWMKINFDIRETKGLSARPLVVFTGKSDTSRDEWVKIAAEKGYAFHKNVNKKVALVVTNDVNSTSTKAKKARSYGIKIITYDEFEVM